MGWKKMILGEKMPDKDDPKYAERIKRENSAGRKFARWLRLDKAAGYAQCFACRHPRWFLALVFGIVVGCLSMNIYNMVRIFNKEGTVSATTVSERQERLLRENGAIKNSNSEDYDIIRYQED